MPGRPNRAESTAGGLLNQALGAGRSAIREAQRRIPPDLRRQVERRVTDALGPVQAQLRSRAAQADLDRLSARVDALEREIEHISRSTGAAVKTEPKTEPKMGPKTGARPAKPADRRPPGPGAAA